MTLLPLPLRPDVTASQLAPVVAVQPQALPPEKFAWKLPPPPDAGALPGPAGLKDAVHPVAPELAAWLTVNG